MESTTISLPACVEVQATGCYGASSYREFAHKNGYKFVEVLDWSSSAGDWQFLVSKDEYEWKILSQENNWPRPGFSHFLSGETFYGTFEEVCNEVAFMYGG